MKRSSLALGVASASMLLLGGIVLLRHHDAAVSPTPAEDAAPRGQAPLAPPWTSTALQDLVGAVRHADQEGLRASDYQMDAIQAALDARQTGAAVDALANRAALALAHDYAAGRIRNRHRFNWYIDEAGPPLPELASQLAAARGQHRLRAWLDGLLPTSSAYRMLRAALAATPAANAERRDRIRANMERWRWLPRDFGRADQLYVNLPTYRLEVRQAGRTVAIYKAVIGATDMPTPALSVPVRQVIANPDWIVPPSIVRRSHLRPGVSSRYIFTTRSDGTLRVRQKPGPGNALGRVKIEFPNRLAIYFHDTPSKSLFGATDRAFSHGCVRVQDIETLARTIVARPDRFDVALAGTTTRSFTTAHAWQASIVYLTLVPDTHGTLLDMGDPYRLDDTLAAALDGRKPRTSDPAPRASAKQAPLTQPQPAPPIGARLGPGADPDDVVVNATNLGATETYNQNRAETAMAR